MKTQIILEKMQADRECLSRHAREIITQSLGAVSIVKDENGKPYIEGRDDVHISISHTDNAVLVGVSDSPIGVDIERVRSIKHDIPKRFFTPDEQEYISKSENDTLAFFEIWTKKESYLKFLGTGLRRSLLSFSVFELKDGVFSSFVKGEYVISAFCNTATDDITLVEL